MITVEKVEALLGKPLNANEKARLDFLIDSALSLINGYTGMSFTNSDAMPKVVEVVALSIINRALGQNVGAVAAGVSQQQYTMGPFSQSTSFSVDSQGGDVWLTRQDKLKLRPLFRGVSEVSLVSPRLEGTHHV